MKKDVKKILKNVKYTKNGRDADINKELRDVLIAISVIAGRLAKRFNKPDEDNIKAPFS